jgi:beta-glucanase (GH16 family)
VLTPDWSLVFEDDFPISNLDTTKWWTRQTHNDGWLDYLNDEQQRYRESGNHVHSAGCCELTALPKVADGFYPSGMLRSKALFPLASGTPHYFECKGRVPGGLGVWPAFWLAGSERVPGDDSTAMWPPEIDMMEIVNNGVEDTLNMCNMRCQVLDWANNPQRYAMTECVESFNPEWGTWWAPFFFNEGFHTWSVLYERPNFTFYCDRQFVARGTYDWVTDDGQPSPPAHILCNLAIGGSWAGRHGIDDSAFPQAFEVEYIKVWTRLPQSTIGHDLMPV